MKSSSLSRVLAPAAIAVLALAAGMDCAAAPPMAMTTQQSASTAPHKTVRVDSAWVRAAPPGAMSLAGYMTLHNDGHVPVRFDWAQSDVFGMVELHRTLTVNGVSTMRVAGDQTIPPGASVRFEPGGLHLMLMQARHELKIGDLVPFRLHFGDGSTVDVVAPVSAQAPAATKR